MLSVFGALRVLLLLFPVLCVDIGHEFLQFVVFLIANLGRSFVVVVLKEVREYVGRGLAIGVAHNVEGGVDNFGKELVLQTVALAIAANDAAYFPEADVVEEFMAGDTYLAHEQLIDVVGAGQFFALPFPFDGLSAGSSFGML